MGKNKILENVMIKKLAENNYFLSLPVDSDIIEVLTEFGKEFKITAGSFCGIGAIKDVSLGFATDDGYSSKTFNNGTYELVSLNGNYSIKSNGDTFAHCHLVMSEENFNCLGGHCFSAKVAMACEINVIKYTETSGVKLERYPHCKFKHLETIQDKKE